MPVLQLSLTPGDGLRVQAQITLGRPQLRLRRQARQPIPQPLTVVALLDTGAERTSVDPTVVTRPNLPVVRAGFTGAPGTGSGSPAFGGATFGFVYEIGLMILHPVTVPPSNLVVHEMEVDALPLAAFGIEAVIGRDVLGSCVLVYNGPTGSATLAY